ncbi:MAG: RDD family protein [Actinomycetota bacterium]|nr:RDD family protein [Actinomycetota bacterium]
MSHGPPPDLGARPEREYPPARSLAGLGRRYVALFVDTMLVSFGASFVTSFLGPESGNERLVFLFSIAIVLSVTDGVVLVALRGQTVGKMLLSVQVVRAHTYAIPGWGPAIIRYLVQAVPLLNIVDPLWAIWDPRKQAIHDKAAKTLVVDA